jgi:hypothetical protein
MSTTDGSNESKNSFTKEGIIHFINSAHGTLPKHQSLATFISGLGTDFDCVVKKDYCFICCEVVFFWMVVFCCLLYFFRTVLLVSWKWK